MKAFLVLFVVALTAAPAWGMVAVDHTEGNFIAAWVPANGACANGLCWVLLTREGNVFLYSLVDNDWTQLTGPIAVPVSEILYWELQMFITFSGQVYRYDSPSRTYELVAEAPESPPVSVRRSSLSDLKKLFGR